MQDGLGYRDDTVFLVVGAPLAESVGKAGVRPGKLLNLSHLRARSTGPTRCSHVLVKAKFVVAGTVAAQVFIVSLPGRCRSSTMSGCTTPSSRPVPNSTTKRAGGEEVRSPCETRGARGVVDMRAWLASWPGCAAPTHGLPHYAVEKPESRHSCNTSLTRWKLL